MERTFIAYKAGGLEAMVLSRLLGSEVKTTDFVKIMQEHKNEKEAADEFVKKDGWMDKKLKEMASCMGKNATRAYNWLGNALGQKDAFNLVFPAARCKFELNSENKIDTDKIRMDTHVTSRLHDCFVTFSRSLTLEKTKKQSMELFRQMESVKEYPSLQKFFDFVDEIKSQYGDDIDHVVNDETIAEAWARVEKKKLRSKQNDLVCYQIDEWEDMYQVANNPRFTKWCVAENTEDYGRDYFDDYAPPYYMFARGHEPVALMHPSDQQFKDKDDEEFEEDEEDEDIIILGFKVLEELLYEGKYDDDFYIFEAREDLDPYDESKDKTDYNAVLDGIKMNENHKDYMEVVRKDVYEKQLSKQKEKEEQQMKRDEMAKNLKSDIRYYINQFNPDFFKQLNFDSFNDLIDLTSEIGGKDLLAETLNAMINRGIDRRFNLTIVVHTIIKKYGDVIALWKKLNKRVVSQSVLKEFLSAKECTEDLVREIYKDFGNSLYACTAIAEHQEKCPTDVCNGILEKFGDEEDIAKKFCMREDAKAGCADTVKYRIINDIKNREPNSTVKSELLSKGKFSEGVFEEFFHKMGEDMTERRQVSFIEHLAMNSNLSEKNMSDIFDMSIGFDKFDNTKTCILSLLWNPSCTTKIIDKIIDYEYFDDIVAFAKREDWGKIASIQASKFSEKAVRVFYNLLSKSHISTSSMIKKLKSVPYDILKNYCVANSCEDINVPPNMLIRLHGDGILSALSNPAFPQEKLIEIAKNGSEEEKRCVMSNVNCPKDILQNEFDKLMQDEEDNRGDIYLIVTNKGFKLNPADVSALRNTDNFIINYGILCNGTFDDETTLGAVDKINSGKTWISKKEEQKNQSVDNLQMAIDAILDMEDQHKKEMCMRRIDFHDRITFANGDITAKKYVDFFNNIREQETFRWMASQFDVFDKFFFRTSYRDFVSTMQYDSKESLQTILTSPTSRNDFRLVKQYLENYGIDEFIVNCTAFYTNISAQLMNFTASSSANNTSEEAAPIMVSLLKKGGYEKGFKRAALLWLSRTEEGVEIKDMLAEAVTGSEMTGLDKMQIMQNIVSNPMFEKNTCEEIMAKYLLVSKPNQVFPAMFQMYLSRFGMSDLLFNYMHEHADDFEDTEIKIKDFTFFTKEDMKKTINCDCLSLRRAAKRELRIRWENEHSSNSSEIKASIMAGKMISAFAQVHRIAMNIARESK